MAGSNGQLFIGTAVGAVRLGSSLGGAIRATSVGFVGAAPEVLALAERGIPLAQPIVETAGRR